MEGIQFSLFDSDLTPPKVADKRVAITGKLGIQRKEAVEMLHKAGGIYASSVTRTTDFLVVGSFAGNRKTTRKLSSARQLLGQTKIQIITPGDFIRALDSANEEDGLTE